MIRRYFPQHARPHLRTVYVALLVAGVGATCAGGIELGEHVIGGRVPGSPAAALVDKSPQAGPAAPSTVPTIPADTGPAVSGTPVRIRIPGIDVDAAVQKLGLGAAGALSVPTQTNQAGWYTGSAVPGLPGPAVIAGHLDTTSGPAVFYGLTRLQAGDEIVVELDSGRNVEYTVTGTQIALKTDFPTTEVYGPTPDSELRLVTCTGDLLRGSYLDNLIVYATEKD